MKDEFDRYEIIAEAKGKIRLYLNDPVIREKAKENKIPITIKGKMVVAKMKDGSFHWFFHHENPDFIPVFCDLESESFKTKDGRG